MLGQVLADVLTPAIGIALSPIPVIAVILMLLSARAGRTAPAFAAGWLLGILLVAGIVMSFVPASAAAGEGGGGVGVGVVKLLLGLLLLVMALKQWRSRPKPGQAAALPKWMAGIDRMPPIRAGLLGAALSALNPKNLPLALAAGLSLAQVDDAGGQITGLVLFVLLAGCSVLVPVVVFLLFAERMARPLASAKDWLQQNNATVMFVVLLVFGVSVIAKGIGTLVA